MKQNEIEATAARLFLEINRDAEKVAGELFGGGPGVGARKMKRDDFVEMWRRNWDNPPRPEWRADELDRFAPRDPATGARPEAGLRAFNALLRDAFPNGRPPDPPPPPPPEVAAQMGMQAPPPEPTPGDVNSPTPTFPPPPGDVNSPTPTFPPPSSASPPPEPMLSTPPPAPESPPPAM
jgi:hypothetical protein